MGVSSHERAQLRAVVGCAPSLPRIATPAPRHHPLTVDEVTPCAASCMEARRGAVRAGDDGSSVLLTAAGMLAAPRSDGMGLQGRRRRWEIAALPRDKVGQFPPPSLRP